MTENGPRSILFAWEKTRFLYNFILAVVVLGTVFAHPYSVFILSHTDSLKHIELWIFLLKGVFFANVFYFAAPVIECYLSWVGFRSRTPRFLLFLAGITLASLLTMHKVHHFSMNRLRYSQSPSLTHILTHPHNNKVVDSCFNRTYHHAPHDCPPSWRNLASLRTSRHNS